MSETIPAVLRFESWCSQQKKPVSRTRTRLRDDAKHRLYGHRSSHLGYTFAAITMIAVAIIGCGTPGAPLPPSLNIPKPVDDLKAIRKGDAVTLTWTAPEETTDGALLKKPGKMIVRRAVLDSTLSTPSAITEIPLKPALKDQQQEVTYKDSVAQLLQAGTGDFAVYMIEALSASGKSAGTSNRIAVPLVLTPATPASVQTQVVPEGISIAWSQPWAPQKTPHLNPQYVYRI